MREQLVRGRMPYLVLWGGWCVVLIVHAPTAGRSYDSEDSLCEEWEQAFKQFPKYRLKFLQKISMEDCINYCGFSLLSASYQILPNICLSRLTPYADNIIQELQYGFQGVRSTADYILIYNHWLYILHSWSAGGKMRIRCGTTSALYCIRQYSLWFS